MEIAIPRSQDSTLPKSAGGVVFRYQHHRIEELVAARLQAYDLELRMVLAGGLDLVHE